jgi:hypothetical protein
MRRLAGNIYRASGESKGYYRIYTFPAERARVRNPPDCVVAADAFESVREAAEARASMCRSKSPKRLN